jgi:DNA-directed RNA polymerase specialized sigma24 family protein
MIDSVLYKRALKFAMKIMKNEENALEAVQDAMLNCHRNNNWYKPFVFECVRNSCFTYLGRIKRRGRLVEKIKRSTVDNDTPKGLNQEQICIIREVERNLKKTMTKKQVLVIEQLINGKNQIESAKIANVSYESFKNYVKVMPRHIASIADTGKPEEKFFLNQIYKPRKRNRNV